MNTKSKVFFAVFFMIIAGSVLATYYRYVVLRDYIIETEVECDPYLEPCFIYVCDPTAGEECTGDLEEDTSYYKIIHRNAKNIPICDPNDEDCEALMCPVVEADCEISFCDPDMEEDIECSDPISYTDEHPLEEELEGGDEESDLEESDESEDNISAEEGTLSADTIEGTAK